MGIEKEIDDNFEQFSRMKIQVMVYESERISILNKCLDCQCFGTLRKVGDKVYLFTEEVLLTRSIHTQKEDIKPLKTWKQKVSLAEHGNATNKQQYSYLGLGSLFWITVMLIGKYKGVEMRMKLSYEESLILVNSCYH